MRRAARRDENEDELVNLARRLGATWRYAGPLDGWLGWDGKWTPVEVKDPKKEGHADEFRPAQTLFIHDCKVDALPFLVWRTANDVLRDLGFDQAAK